MTVKPVKVDLQAGDTLGDFRIEALLGEGAMGSVFRARRDGQPIALKIVRLELADDERYRRRFLNEARAAAEVQHEHLVDVLEAGEADGRQYLAMRFVEGVALEQRICDSGPLDFETVVRLGTEIGGALDALHAVGLIHRDVKASNVMIDRDGAAALTDFGLAKGTGYASLTQPGQILGTLDYLAPERIRGEPATPASDIYGLGCVIYECIAGGPPFASKGAMEVAFAHLEEQPPDPCAGRPDAPAALPAAVVAALAKQPAARPLTAGAYADLLRGALAV